MTKNRNENIDIIRGLGILLVIIGHAIQRGIVGFDNIPLFITAINKVIEAFNMPLFFCISGYLFSKGGIKNGLPNWIVKRAIRILYPWFIWRWILWGMRCFSFTGLSPWYDDLPANPLEYLGTFITSFVGKPLWFLPTMFILGCLVAIGWNLFKTDNSKILYLTGLLVVGTICLHFISNSYLEQYLYFYILGALCGISKIETALKSKAVPIIVAGSFLIIYGIIELSNYQPVFLTYLKKYMLGSALCIIFSLVVVWILKIVKQRNRIVNKIKQYFIFMGKNSLEFYLVEFLCLNIGLKINVYLSVASILVTCLCISSVAVYLIKSKFKFADIALFGHFKLK